MASAGFTSEGEKGVGLCSGLQEFSCSTFRPWNGLLSPIPYVRYSNKFYMRRSLIVAIKDVFET